MPIDVGPTKQFMERFGHFAKKTSPIDKTKNKSTSNKKESILVRAMKKNGKK